VVVRAAGVEQRRATKTGRFEMKSAFAVIGLFCFCFMAAQTGCNEPEPHGAAPYVEALTFSPEVVTVGQSNTVTGTFAFDDPDGDAGRIAFRITDPSNQTQDVEPQEVPGLRGQTSGTVQFTLSFQPAAAGLHTIEVWLIDDTDFESNHLSGEVEAEQ
jgi:hypothetical protein